MNETSCGIIPLRKRNGKWEALLILHHAGHWGFPKGHAEAKESHLQTAERELFEETGLKIKRILATESLTDTYHFTKNQQHIKKTVVYFLAEVAGTVSLQASEVKDAKWISLAEAAERITFPSAKALCHKIVQLLKP